MGVIGVIWLGIGPVRRPRKKVAIRILLLAVTCWLTVMTGCGGFAPAILPGGGTNVTTPPGTYFITGTAHRFIEKQDPVRAKTCRSHPAEFSYPTIS